MPTGWYFTILWIWSLRTCSGQEEDNRSSLWRFVLPHPQVFWENEISPLEWLSSLRSKCEDGETESPQDWMVCTWQISKVLLGISQIWEWFSALVNQKAQLNPSGLRLGRLGWLCQTLQKQHLRSMTMETPQLNRHTHLCGHTGISQSWFSEPISRFTTQFYYPGMQLYFAIRALCVISQNWVGRSGHMEGLEHFLSLRTQRSSRYTEKKQPNVGKKQQYISDKKKMKPYFFLVMDSVW